MKNSISSLKKIASITGLFLGAFAISVAAATWTPPTVAPPDGNIDAPINAGASVQGKIGKLGLGAATPRAGTQVLDVIGSALIDNVVTNTLTVVTNAGAGKVLTSDASGAATWQPSTANSKSLIFSPKITASGSGNSIIGPSSSYSACFLTKSGISSSGNTNGSCSVYDNGDNWVIDATAGANDSSSCVAQCMKLGVPLTVSCSTNVNTATIGSPVTWTSTVSGGITPYTYVWTATDSASAVKTNPTLNVSYTSSGTKYASVQVSSPGYALAIAGCTNPNNSGLVVN